MENYDWRRVDPVHPPAPYIGGKRYLGPALVNLIERTAHSAYAEPFIGMGGVFLRRRLVPKSEVINDISGDVVTFFRILQRHYVPFMDMLKFQFTSRREFERLMAVEPATLTDLERAARFIYVQRTAFGGKVAGRNFGLARERGGRFDVTTLGPLLADLNERLSGVVIENLDWSDFIARYDSRDTLFYLDPPYFGCEGDYGKNVFQRADFARMADILAGLKGQFILTLNAVPEVREMFSAFSMEEIKVLYSITDGPPQEALELIITSQNLRLTPPPQPGLF